MKQNIDEVLNQLDQMIAAHSILEHPFYQAWSAGTLSQEDLAVYSWAYFPHVEAFPDYLRNAIDVTKPGQVREFLVENLNDELGDIDIEGAEPHTTLWQYFAEGMGINQQELEEAKPLPEVERSVATFKKLCGQSTLSALAALYAYESQQPEVSKTKGEGLCELYQIDDKQTLSYFTCHEIADVRHREDEREALRLCLEEGGSSHELFEAAQAALDAHWGLLDGVCRQAGISC